MNMRMAFYADGYSDGIAANRLRLLQPLHFLQQQGVHISRYDESIGPEGYDAIIFSRAHSRASLRIAEAARAARRTIAYDVCDNLFQGYQSWHDRHRAPRFAAMIRLADIVTTPTRVLGATLKANVPDTPAAFRVVPDALEHLPQAEGEADLAPLQRFLGAHSGALHCVWFGSSTKQLAGLAHLDRAVAELETFARQQPVTLTIISDTRWRYWISKHRWRLPTFYQRFALSSFRPALAQHRVAIIPVVKNPYTIGKSINRPATALLAGLGVIADSIDSYEELRPFIRLDDWQAGLAHYARTAPADDAGLDAARRYLESRYGPEAIGQSWLGLIDEIRARRAQ